jgi:hypothetical protein
MAKEVNKDEALAVKETETEAVLATQSEVTMGFEDDDSVDMIIPRIKVVQTLSPERKDSSAAEGDIINSLTKEKYNGKKFIPVFKFNNNVEWKDRSDGGGIKCIARDGKMGEASDGTTLLCASCKRCEFDNTKQGREAAPKCTKYINFFGFIEGERMPVILSFGKTNFNEGKKLYSLAKVTMQNMWNYGYTLNEKLQAKGGNEWYIIVPVAAGASTEEDRAFALEMYKSFRSTIQAVNYDMDEAGSAASSAPAPNVEKTEF